MNMRVFYKSLLFLLGFFSVQMKGEREVNIATWGTTVQSSLFYNAYSQKALDGLNYICSGTTTQTNPWWKVDLMKTYSVNRVTITNIHYYCCDSWINGAEIRIGSDSSNIFSNPVCAVVSSIPAGATYSYSCHGMEGRYVSVNIPGASKTLTLCEVGVYVITGNLATGKTATQSSTTGSWSAEQAIDFNPGFTKSWSACSLTKSQNNPWWRVDLSSVYQVNRVIITNRQDCCQEQINGAEIRIGNSLENKGNNNPICAVISGIPAGVSSTYECNNTGRYVNLFIPGNSRFLALCEVEVYGEDPIFQEDPCEYETEDQFEFV